MPETKKTTKKVNKVEKTSASKIAPKKSATEVKAKKTAQKAVVTDSKVFAVIETGGKQYRVKVGEYFKTEKIADDMKVWDKVVFDKVLLVDDGTKTEIGAPYLDGKKVEGELLLQGQAKKLIVLRYKPKSNYAKKKGHRELFMQILITKI